MSLAANAITYRQSEVQRLQFDLDEADSNNFLLARDRLNLERELADAAKRLKEKECELAAAAKTIRSEELHVGTLYAQFHKYYDRGYDDGKAKRPRNNDWFCKKCNDWVCYTRNECYTCHAPRSSVSHTPRGRGNYKPRGRGK